MDRVVLATLENIENQTSFIEALNANFTILGEEFDDTLSRVAIDSANQMETSLDMNSNRILNLPSPLSGSDPARWADVTSAIAVDMIIPALLGNSGKYLSNDGTDLIWTTSTGGLLAVNNLSDLTSVTTARGNLGLGTVATFNVGTSGSTVPLLNNANVWATTQTWNGVGVFNNGGSFNGATEWRILTTGATTLNADSLGFRGAPQNIKDIDYTFVLDDMGKGVTHSSASPHAWTIPPDASVPFPDHTVILLDNFGAGTVTITRGAGVTLRQNGSGTSADVSLPQYFIRPIYKQGPNFWVVL